MRCPYCRHDETKVIDSRTSADFAIRRRRECLECSRRFTTYEKIEELPIKVIKKDGSRVPFNREKIREGLEKACYKRPVSEQDIEEIISQTEAEVYENYEREVPSRMIGEQVIERLRKGIRSPLYGSPPSIGNSKTSTISSKSWARCSNNAPARMSPDQSQWSLVVQFSELRSSSVIGVSTLFAGYLCESFDVMYR